MKILLADDSVSGHHQSYLLELAKIPGNEVSAVLPERVEAFPGRQYICPPPDKTSGRSVKAYLKWLKQVYLIAEQVRPDVIHFLDGDFFYRFFGLGLGKFRKYRPIMTLHWARPGKLQETSLRLISRTMTKMVVHSDYLRNHLAEIGVKNPVHIEYPEFNGAFALPREEACAFWHLDPKIPVISCVGNTRQDKGLDLLLEALAHVPVPFQLLIAGKPEAFDAEFVRAHSQSYGDRVTLRLAYLTDTELQNAVNAADIIALPYRRSFNGASGPLTEGVWCGKCIVGSNHGNLGYTIEHNHLGETFEAENPRELAAALTKALSSEFHPDQQYQAFRENLKPEKFRNHYSDLYRA